MKRYRLFRWSAVFTGMAILLLFLLGTSVHGAILVLHGPLSIFRGVVAYMMLLLLISGAAKASPTMLSRTDALADPALPPFKVSTGPSISTLDCCLRC